MRPQSALAWGESDRLRAAALPIAVLLLAVSLGLFLLEASLTSHFHHFLTWFDLNVYNDAGVIARHRPNALYTWRLRKDIKFTYTPFAALVFAVASLLKLRLLHWSMTVVSMVALPVVAWLVFRALGWPGRERLAGTAFVAAVALWTEPVMRALQLGQIELLLMLLIVADLGQSDRRRWKGAGIGLAAAIKMVPLIFIPYLVLCGKIRQAVVASVTVAATIGLGFALLPKASAHWWLTGYFLHAGNVGDVASMANQSLLATITREVVSVTVATRVWLPIAIVVAAIGLSAGAVLHRRGYPVAGWVTCALTGLLVSPISWDHHWIWIVPVLIVLMDRAVRSGGPARWAWTGGAVAVFGLYANWPYSWAGRTAFLTDCGLISFFSHKHPHDEVYHLRGFQIITWNLFVLAGLVMLAVAVGAAVRAWQTKELQETRPTEPVEATSGNSPHPA